jgi:hypothetical protein
LAKVVKDTATVSNAGEGLPLIHHDQIWDDGDNMGGDLVCQASAAAWLADRLDEASGPQGAPEVEQAMLPDHFTVFCGGSDWEPNVHLHNDRDPGAPRGKTYVLSGLQETTTRSLAAQLRALK